MRRSMNFLVYFLSFGVALYAVVVYLFFPLGLLVHPSMKLSFELHPIGVYTHIFASAAALLAGPTQFSVALRHRNMAFHRLCGRFYLFFGVLIGGTAGLYIAQFAFGGLLSQLGFSLLSISWLYTGWMAYSAIRRHDIQEHRRWMIRSFSLTFAAVTIRLYLGLFSAMGLAVEEFYPFLAWLCWIPNLLFAQWIIYSIRHSTDFAPALPRAPRN